MYTKIICSKGFMYWVDLSSCVIEETTYRTKDGDKHRLILKHSANAVDGGEIEWISLTDYMEKEELKEKYGSMLPVVLTLDFNKGVSN